MASDDSKSISTNELASSDDDTENNPSSSFGLPTTKTVLPDHRQFSHTKYERPCKWLYFSHLKNGFMCKICTVFYGDSPCPVHTSQGAWKNPTYISHETCDSLNHSLDNYFLTKPNERIKKCNDIVLYTDESTSAARKEMLGIFLAIFAEMDKTLK